MKKSFPIENLEFVFRLITWHIFFQRVRPDKYEQLPKDLVDKSQKFWTLHLQILDYSNYLIKYFIIFKNFPKPHVYIFYKNITNFSDVPKYVFGINTLALLEHFFLL